MTWSDDALRRAFAARPVELGANDGDVSPDELWAVATGERGGPAAQALVARCAHDPALAEQWRLTFEIARRSGCLDSAEPSTARDHAPSRSIAWLGVAVAAAAAAVLVVVLPTRPAPPDPSTVEPVLREAESSTLEAVTPDGAVLPRDRMVLRWRGAPEGSHYELWVETEALEPVLVAPDINAPSFRVDPARLEGIEAGAVLHWRVVALTPEGVRLESSSHRVRLR